MVRGDVHAIVISEHRGHVQHGRRYAVIVQADDLLALSTIVVCPTSTSTPPASFHPEIEIDDQATRVMCEMVVLAPRIALRGRVRSAVPALLTDA